MKRLDGERIRRAIDAAEAGTTGRIAVRITRERVPDALESARRHFHHAHLHEHPDANGVIFLVAPRARRFAVFGGKRIHDHLGDAFWVSIVTEMKPYFASGDPTGGLVHGIERVGEQMREHFPSGVPA